MTLDRRNIPVVVVELGGGIVDQKPYVERGLAGLLNMLRKLEVIDGDVAPPPKQTVVRAIKHGTADAEAVCSKRSRRRSGRPSSAASCSARIVSPYSFEILEEIPTPYDSGVMILSHLGRNLVEAGDYAYMVGDLEGSEP